MALRARFLMVGLVRIGSPTRPSVPPCSRPSRTLPLKRWPEDGPSLTAAARDGTDCAQVGTEGWCRSNKWMGLPNTASRTLYRVREAEVPILSAAITVMKKNLVSFYFASPIILCASNSVSRFQTPLLPLGSTDSLGNFDGGNKTKTIANLDQTIRRIPPKTVLRLNCTSQPAAVRELIAALIVAAASRGELDPIRLRMAALAGFAMAQRRLPRSARNAAARAAS